MIKAENLPLRWQCSYCRANQVVTEQNASFGFVAHAARNGTKFGVRSLAIKCLNEDCNGTTFEVDLVGITYWQAHGWRPDGEPWREWRLMPESSALPQPSYIPQVLVDDYFEACRIRDLSPKASATLARRCLQGMIRDFCKISKGTLDSEIRELRAEVDAGTAPRAVTMESVDAIDAVRSVGNIGAHMEKDVNLIVDIDPDEAQLLIGLIEMLFNEWYVQTEQRRLRLAGISALSEQKKLERKGGSQPAVADQSLGALGASLESPKND